jgi:hypothetical protein
MASPDSTGSHPEVIHVGLERGKGLEFKPQLLLRLKKKKKVGNELKNIILSEVSQV